MFELWANGILIIEECEAIKLVCSVNRGMLKDARRAYRKGYEECDIASLGSVEEVEKW